jgi:phospho-N-acetylmuramoyl-pentapeptide-transferase
MISLYLGLLIFSFLITSVLVVPFINLLYKMKFYRRVQKTKDAEGNRTKIFDKFHNIKAGTPVGGGFLVIVVTSVLYLILFPLLSFMGTYIQTSYQMTDELNILFLTFISFGLLGLYDDIKKFFGFEKSGFFGLRMRHKFIIQWILAFIISLLMYFNLGIDIINIPFLGVLKIGPMFVPLAAFIIVSMANAFNITDGLDGLSSGLLLISLFAFWILSHSILDTPLSVFIAVWIGALLAFLYFNVYPARIFLGDVGALSFGATLAVVGLLVGKVVALAVIGGLFVVEVLSSLIQILSKKFLKRKAFAVAPFHLWLQNQGWEEPKIVMRGWLAGIILAVLGLWLAYI